MKLAPIVTAIALTLGLVPTNIQAQEPSLIAGTWVLNRAASTCSPGTCLRGTERTFEDRGDGSVRATLRGVTEAGRVVRQNYTAKHDGEPYRMVMSGVEGFRTIEFTRLDTYSSFYVMRVDGEVIQMGTTTVSRDGQTYTMASGPGVHVFDRQP